MKNKYETYTLCDSEILLRLFQGREDGLSGIVDIWSMAYESQMAVAIGEFTNQKRKNGRTT